MKTSSEQLIRQQNGVECTELSTLRAKIETRGVSMDYCGSNSLI